MNQQLEDLLNTLLRIKQILNPNSLLHCELQRLMSELWQCNQIDRDIALLFDLKTLINNKQHLVAIISIANRREFEEINVMILQCISTLLAKKTKFKPNKREINIPTLSFLKKTLCFLLALGIRPLDVRHIFKPYENQAHQYKKIITNIESSLIKRTLAANQLDSIQVIYQQVLLSYQQFTHKMAEAKQVQFGLYQWKRTIRLLATWVSAIFCGILAIAMYVILGRKMIGKLVDRLINSPKKSITRITKIDVAIKDKQENIACLIQARKEKIQLEAGYLGSISTHRYTTHSDSPMRTDRKKFAIAPNQKIPHFAWDDSGCSEDRRCSIL